MERYFRLDNQIVDIHNIINIYTSSGGKDENKLYYFVLDVVDFMAEVYSNCSTKSRIIFDSSQKQRFEAFREYKQSSIRDLKPFIKKVYSKPYTSKDEFKKVYNNMIDYIEAYSIVLYDSIPNFD